MLGFTFSYKDKSTTTKNNNLIMSKNLIVFFRCGSVKLYLFVPSQPFYPTLPYFFMSCHAPKGQQRATYCCTCTRPSQTNMCGHLAWQVSLEVSADKQKRVIWTLNSTFSVDIFCECGKNMQKILFMKYSLL